MNQTKHPINVSFHFLLPHRVFTLVLATCLGMVITVAGRAQTTISAGALLAQIERGESVNLEGAIITGDLDFTQLNNKKKGGSYGIRNGAVREYIAQVTAPITLTNCTLQGRIRTRSEEQDGRVRREYFTAFRAPLILENCRLQGDAAFESLTFDEQLTIRNCTFQENLTFEKIHFTTPPVLEENTYRGRLINRETNWPERAKASSPPPAPEEKAVTILLKNPSLAAVEIQFGADRWRLSPLGTSTLQTAAGQKIYLRKDGKRDRLLLTVTPEIAGKTIDVTKL